jgi:hypothetical protein
MTRIQQHALETSQSPCVTGLFFDLQSIAESWSRSAVGRHPASPHRHMEGKFIIDLSFESFALEQGD